MRGANHQGYLMGSSELNHGDTETRRKRLGSRHADLDFVVLVQLFRQAWAARLPCRDAARCASLPESREMLETNPLGRVQTLGRRAGVSAMRTPLAEKTSPLRGREFLQSIVRHQLLHYSVSPCLRGEDCAPTGVDILLALEYNSPVMQAYEYTAGELACQ